MKTFLIALLWSLQIGGASKQTSGTNLERHPATSDSATLPVIATERLVSPQREIEVGRGRHLNVVCLGSGTPTVIFESGTGGGAFDWRFVQSAIADKTTACSYDRAGFGFSDPAQRASDANDAVDDLQQLIVRAPLQLPLILVGHSNGGMYAVRFAGLHQDELSAMVLVDPGFTGQQNFSEYGLSSSKSAELEAGNAEWIQKARSCRDLAQTGKLAALTSSSCLDEPPNSDAALHRALDRIESSPAFTAALLSEFESTFRKVNGTTANDREVPLIPASLGKLPITVLTASRHPATPSDFTPEDQARYYAFWKTGHDRLAALSQCGRNLVVPDSGHFIQYDHPQVVILNILRYVEESRHSTLKACLTDR